LIANLSAPIIAESDTLSITGFIEELIQISQDQARIAELTAKLNTAVQTLKQSSGVPVNQAEASVPPSVEEVKATPTPIGVQKQVIAKLTKQCAELEERNRVLIATQRVLPLVKEAQSLGLLKNYASLKAAGMSRVAAKKHAQAIVVGEVKRLLGLSEEAFAEAERGLRLSIAQARKYGATDAGTMKRTAAVKELTGEHGELIGALPGHLRTASNTLDPSKPSTGPIVKWSIASGLSPEKMKELQAAQVQGRK